MFEPTPPPEFPDRPAPARFRFKSTVGRIVGPVGLRRSPIGHAGKVLFGFGSQVARIIRPLIALIGRQGILLCQTLIHLLLYDLPRPFRRVNTVLEKKIPISIPPESLILSSRSTRLHQFPVRIDIEIRIEGRSPQGSLLHWLARIEAPPFPGDLFSKYGLELAEKFLDRKTGELFFKGALQCRFGPERAFSTDRRPEEANFFSALNPEHFLEPRRRFRLQLPSPPFRTGSYNQAERRHRLLHRVLVIPLEPDQEDVRRLLPPPFLLPPVGKTALYFALWQEAEDGDFNPNQNDRIRDIHFALYTPALLLTEGQHLSGWTPLFASWTPGNRRPFAEIPYDAGVEFRNTGVHFHLRDPAGPDDFRETYRPIRVLQRTDAPPPFLWRRRTLFRLDPQDYSLRIEQEILKYSINRLYLLNGDADDTGSTSHQIGGGKFSQGDSIASFFSRMLDFRLRPAKGGFFLSSLEIRSLITTTPPHRYQVRICGPSEPARQFARATFPPRTKDNLNDGDDRLADYRDR